MKKILNISLIFLLLINLSLLSIAQDLPVACAGSIERYRVQGSPNSDFNWEVTGGTIHRFYNDSIDIRWNSIAGTRTITVTEINIFGCEGQPYSQTLVVTAPFIDIGLDVVNICSGETHEFEAVVDDVESYLWQDNVSNGETFIASVSGEYWVKVTDSNGCVNADTADLVIHENPAVDLGPDTTLCGEGEQIDLDVSDVGGINYEWSNGSLSAYSSVYSSTSDQVVWVVVSDINGCEGSDTVVVRFCGTFEVPNVFSPNEDGSNDVWVIEELFSYPEATVDIYNRWGERVYHTRGYSSNKYWNGKDQKGNKLPMDSYYYVIDLHNDAEPIVGTVTIIR